MHGVKMTRLLGGYFPSGRKDLAPAFTVSDTVRNLGSPNNNNQYIIPTGVPVLDQLGTNSCVANSSAAAFEMLKYIETGVVEFYSRLFVWWNARNMIKATKSNSGCFIHDCFTSIKNTGMCLEIMFPFDENEIYNEPPILSYKQANDNKINNFYQITSSGNQRINDIEAAVRANHPVVFGTSVGQELENYTGGVLNPPAKSDGGHAMLAVGVRSGANGKEFLIRNSWGASFGLNGYCWFSANYLAWSETNDLFVPTLMPNLLV